MTESQPTTSEDLRVSVEGRAVVRRFRLLAAVLLLSFAAVSALAHVERQRVVGELERVVHDHAVSDPDERHAPLTAAADALRERVQHAELLFDLSLFAVLAGAAVFLLESATRRLAREIERADRAGRSSEAAFQELTALRAAMDEHTLFSIADPAGRIVEVNQGFCRISGYGREELVGRDHRLLNSGHHDSDFWAEMWGTVLAGRPWRREVCNRAKDGSLYWVDSTNIPQLDREGNVERIISLRFDVTDKKRAEEAAETMRLRLEEQALELEALQARFQRSVDGSAEGLWEVELPDGRAWYSDQFRRLLGFTPETFDELQDRMDEWSSRLHPVDSERVLAAVRAHLEEGVPYEEEYRLRCADGSYRWFHARGEATRDAGGEPILFSGTLADVHERRIAEERLELAVRVGRLGLWDWNVETGGVYFSDGYARLLGHELHEIEMELDSWLEALHPDDRGSALEAVERHFRGETEHYEHEHRLRTADGDWLWVRDVGEVVERAPDGSPLRMIGLELDIQDLRRSTEAAEAASRAKSDFLANVSHELRTPMTAILGFAELLEVDEELRADPERTQDALRTIRSNGEHLLEIINDVLDMSKIEAGRMTLERIAVRPAALVHDVVELVRPQAETKGLELTLTSDGPVPERIASDPTRLRQVLLNLIGNAIKFTERGRIDVRLRCDRELERLELEIADTGLGMTPEQVERVRRFEAFNQADTSTTRNFGGTGLGLRISSSLAEALGGGIELESEYGHGSTFRVRVATGSLEGVADERRTGRVAGSGGLEAPAAALPKRPGRALEGLRILLAEDGRDNQRLISLLLRREGAEVELAENGRVAVQRATGAREGEAYDVVLMDMQMPELDGYDATRALRGAGVELPVLALTAHARPEDRDRCLAAGCDDFLTKPVDRTALVEACRRWAERGAPEAGTRPEA